MQDQRTVRLKLNPSEDCDIPCCSGTVGGFYGWCTKYFMFFTGGPDRKKFLAKRIGQLHMSYLEMHKICAQSELEENKVRS